MSGQVDRDHTDSGCCQSLGYVSPGESARAKTVNQQQGSTAAGVVAKGDFSAMQRHHMLMGRGPDLRLSGVHGNSFDETYGTVTYCTVGNAPESIAYRNAVPNIARMRSQASVAAVSTKPALSPEVKGLAHHGARS